MTFEVAAPMSSGIKEKREWLYLSFPGLLQERFSLSSCWNLYARNQGVGGATLILEALGESSFFLPLPDSGAR